MTAKRVRMLRWRTPNGSSRSAPPAGAVYVSGHGFGMESTKWQNPFFADHSPVGRQIAVRRYRAYLRDTPALVAAARTELRGKDLACYCPLDLDCHADMLLWVAAGGDP
jgi:hypothetical protein